MRPSSLPSGARTAAALAAAALALLVLPPSARPCSSDMFVADEALTVLGSWPAQDQAGYPVDGILRIFHGANVHRRRVPADFAVRVIQVDTGVEVPVRFQEASHRPATEAWWAPDSDWQPGVTYRMEVSRPDSGEVLHTVTWQVGPGPERPVGFLDDVAEWCDDAIPVLRPCTPAEVEGCDPCSLDYVSAWIPKTRLRLNFPDAEIWARTGRTAYLGGDSLADRRLVTEGEQWQAHFAGAELGACFELRVQTRQGQVETRMPLCWPEPLPRCPGAHQLPEASPGDGGAPIGELDAAAPDPGDLDAGPADAGRAAERPVEEKSGCQATELPAPAGLLGLLLLGLRRRRPRAEGPA